MSVHKHKEHKIEDLSVAVITVSDTRTEEEDKSGEYIKGRFEQEGHEIGMYRIVPDTPMEIRRAVQDSLAAGAEVIVMTGGTGISPRDNTAETVEALFDKKIPGFGELFRMISYEEIGSAAMLSRAAGGIVEGVPLFSLPGSRGGVRTALEKLIFPELNHIFHLLEE